MGEKPFKVDMDRPIHVTIDFDFLKEGVAAGTVHPDKGASTCIFYVSIMGVPDNGQPMSIAMTSCCPPNGDQLTPTQIFSIWGMMAKMLSEQLPESNGRLMCSEVWEACRNRKLILPPQEQT